MIIDRLIQRITELHNPTVVGLDPRLDMVPAFIRDAAFAEHGNTPAGAAEAFYRFNVGLIDAIADIVPAVKPQVSMYEQYGAAGMDAFIRTIAYAKSKGMVVIGDIKRGDIASTAEAYSDGHLGRVDINGEKAEVFGEDFITVNPYMGSDSVEPYLKNCKDFGKGIFVLVKTSNKGSGDLQDLVIGANGQTIYETVGQYVSDWGKDFIGVSGFSSIGAVVGATYPAQAEKLRAQMPHTFFLVPGYGAQGGKAEDLAVCFNADGIGAIVNNSRGIIAAYKAASYKEKFNEAGYADAARCAALDMQADLRRCIPC